MDTKENFKYFSHKDCEYFPCHENADPENFNCLFCFCPLYMLAEECGGNFTYTQNGYKDCSSCHFPHKRENYQKIMDKYMEIAARMSKMK